MKKTYGFLGIVDFFLGKISLKKFSVRKKSLANPKSHFWFFSTMILFPKKTGAFVSD